jgi:hypothetical protein
MSSLLRHSIVFRFFVNCWAAACTLGLVVGSWGFLEQLHHWIDQRILIAGNALASVAAVVAILYVQHRTQLFYMSWMGLLLTVLIIHLFISHLALIVFIYHLL